MCRWDPDSDLYPWPGHRVNCLKAIHFTAAHTYAAYMWQYLPPRGYWGDSPNLVPRVFSFSHRAATGRKFGTRLVRVHDHHIFTVFIKKFTEGMTEWASAGNFLVFKCFQLVLFKGKLYPGNPPPAPPHFVLYWISTQKIEGKREFRSLECASKQWDILSKFKIWKTILQNWPFCWTKLKLKDTSRCLK